MEKQRVLVLDIETKPLKVFVWDTRDQNIAVNQIIEDSAVIAWSAKWLGGKQILYRDARLARDFNDDRVLISSLWALMDTADIIIGQNSKAFDAKRLNARFMHHGMRPPSPYKHLDTYLIAKNAGSFTKNSLEYLAVFLGCKHSKLKHSKFPGQELWNECLKGNMAAWEEMKRYNINDVLTTEELYDKLKAWAPDNAPNVYIGGCCGVCGGKTIKRGYCVNKMGRYPRHQCQNCGKWSLGKKGAA